MYYWFGAKLSFFTFVFTFNVCFKNEKKLKYKIQNHFYFNRWPPLKIWSYECIMHIWFNIHLDSLGVLHKACHTNEQKFYRIIISYWILHLFWFNYIFLVQFSATSFVVWNIQKSFWKNHWKTTQFWNYYWLHWQHIFSMRSFMCSQLRSQHTHPLQKS